MVAIGQLINARYEVLEKTGEGSLFTVFRTRDRIANRLLAVKVLKPEYAAEPEVASAIVTHAEQLVPLAHANLTQVTEARRADDVVYLAEEHVRGMNLKDRIRRIAPFTVASAVDVAMAIAGALDYLHRAGLLHGDLRPQKVLMGPEGDIKVTGSGLALATSGHDDLRSLALMRAVHYSAPELFDGARPSPQTDMYSLGVVLYEMLTGTLPFLADSAITVAMKHMKDPVPSARDRNAGIPRALEGIIARAMAKNPDERYDSAAEMYADLASARDSLRLGRPLSWSPGEKAAAPESEVAMPRVQAEESIWKGLAKALLLVTLVAAVVFAGIAFLMRGAPGEVTIPDLLGLTASAARDRLEPLTLTLEVDREDYNEKYDEGEIFFSAPQSGERVKEETAVRVYVSKGPRNAAIPDVVGVSESRAVEVLREYDFLVGGTDQVYSATVPAGDIVRQSPAAATKAPRNSKVSLIVSLGPDPASVAPPEPEPPTEPEAEVTAPPEDSPLRKLRVNFTVPDGGPRKVQIIVKDDTGEWTALDEDHEGGDKVSTTINATGKRVEIRTYMDGKLVDRQTK